MLPDSSKGRHTDCGPSGAAIRRITGATSIESLPSRPFLNRKGNLCRGALADTAVNYSDINCKSFSLFDRRGARSYSGSCGKSCARDACNATDILLLNPAARRLRAQLILGVNDPGLSEPAMPGSISPDLNIGLSTSIAEVGSRIIRSAADLATLSRSPLDLACCLAGLCSHHSASA